MGEQGIATLQTTTIDQDIQAVSLTTVLAHSSGEWIASDWPVCTLSDMATPRRMGAALTYARRYALFTLVGIAGEDDLDAPEIDGHPTEPSRPPGNGGGAGKPNGRSGDKPLGSFAKGRKPWSPSRELLASADSAALRQRLLRELAVVTDADQLTAWAHRSLPAKNRLTTADAAQVEAEFATRVEALENRNSAETTLPSPATNVENVAEPTGRAELVAALRASVELAAATGAAQPSSSEAGSNGQERVNDAVAWHIDKSALALGEPRRYRDPAHLKFVSSQPCLICGRYPSDAHHVRFLQPRALGRKVSDEFAVPLCRAHHRALHRRGDEQAWWQQANLDPAITASRLWARSRLGEKKTDGGGKGGEFGRI